MLKVYEQHTNRPYVFLMNSGRDATHRGCRSSSLSRSLSSDSCSQASQKFTTISKLLVRLNKRKRSNDRNNNSVQKKRSYDVDDNMLRQQFPSWAMSRCTSEGRSEQIDFRSSSDPYETIQRQEIKAPNEPPCLFSNISTNQPQFSYRNTGIDCEQPILPDLVSSKVMNSEEIVNTTAHNDANVEIDPPIELVNPTALSHQLSELFSSPIEVQSEINDNSPVSDLSRSSNGERDISNLHASTAESSTQELLAMIVQSFDESDDVNRKAHESVCEAPLSITPRRVEYDDVLNASASENRIGILLNQEQQQQMPCVGTNAPNTPEQPAQISLHPQGPQLRISSVAPVVGTVVAVAPEPLRPDFPAPIQYHGIAMCHCGFIPFVRKSNTFRNAGRLFFTCRKGKCSYFAWCNEVRSAF